MLAAIHRQHLAGDGLGLHQVTHGAGDILRVQVQIVWSLSVARPVGATNMTGLDALAV